MSLPTADEIRSKLVANMKDKFELTGSGSKRGEPVENEVGRILKDSYPGQCFTQHKFIEELLKSHEEDDSSFSKEGIENLLPKNVTCLISGANHGPTMDKMLGFDLGKEHDDDDNHPLYLQQATADLIMYDDIKKPRGKLVIIDVKCHNQGSRPGNGKSGMKIAKMCRVRDNLEVYFVFVNLDKDGNVLKTEVLDVFKIDPKTLAQSYNPRQGQLQFSSDFKKFVGSRNEWAKKYLNSLKKTVKKKLDSARNKNIKEIKILYDGSKLI
jgi:hypothetical protein